MSKTILFLLAVAAMCGCGDNTNYQLGTMMVVPDSLRDDVAECIQKTMSGSSRNLTTSDYEDVDDAIRVADWACTNAYSKPVRCLNIVKDNGYIIRTISPIEMTATQLRIMDSLSTH